MTNIDRSEDLCRLLVELGVAISDHVVRYRDPNADFREVGFEGGDTIFAIDRLVEPLITSTIKGWPRALLPIVVVAEGMGEAGTTVIGDLNEKPRYRLLIDPIDGTRAVMYDKRSAWFLAAAAPDRGENTRLCDSIVSVMVEIPNSKQFLADIWMSRVGAATSGIRRNIFTDEKAPIASSPSSNENLRNGFAQVSNFFPGTKRLASDLMELIATRSGDQAVRGQSLIFEDQYISTGGQFAELMTGHDRFCCDLRPIFYDIIAKRSGNSSGEGLQCHPYDVAGLLAARNSGVVITDAWGRELDAPFDVTTSVHWCGYANPKLRKLIEPTIQEWISAELRK